jgi:hypothetical protein
MKMSNAYFWCSGKSVRGGIGIETFLAQSEISLSDMTLKIYPTQCENQILVFYDKS